jgi:biopolymer transport protein ExbB
MIRFQHHRCLTHQPILALASLLIALMIYSPAANAQDRNELNAPTFSTPSAAQGIDPAEIAELQRAANAPAPPEVKKETEIDVAQLLIKGGWVMILLGIASLFVVMWCLERLFSLRNSRIMPRRFVRGLTQLIRKSDLLPVQEAYRLCQQYPSVSANVVATTLVRAGRPLAEIEKSGSEAIQREVDSASGPVRWLAFLAAVGPLLGLFGTVLGLIRTFHATTQLDPSQNRIESLATGIYEALVTTLAGLMVAIPAMLAAQYFENRILRQFRRVEDLLALLLPRLEGYENRTRFDPIGDELVARDVQPAAPRIDGSNVRNIRGTVIAPPVTDSELANSIEEPPTVGTHSRRTGGLRSDRTSSRNG